MWVSTGRKTEKDLILPSKGPKWKRTVGNGREPPGRNLRDPRGRSGNEGAKSGRKETKKFASK